jgi:hypothetical protein
MEFIVWIIVAIVFGLIKNAMKGGFPKFPDMRDDTPLGPGGHRQWPPKPPVTGQSPGSRRRYPMTPGQPGRTIIGRPGHDMATRRSVDAFDQGDERNQVSGPEFEYRGIEGRGAEGQGQFEGRSEYEARDPVAPTLREPHETVQTTLIEPHETVRETVQVSTQVRPAPQYRNEKRGRPGADTERAFSGQSSYDRIGSDPVGRLARRHSPFSLRKEDLVRGVVLAEILGPPRARNPYRTKSDWGRR